MILSITDQTGAKLELSYEQLIKHTPYTVLYFYPKDNTPGCTLEANDFRSLSEQFTALGCQIIGISKDNYKSHCTFIQKQGLNFRLISDPEYTLHKQFNTLGEKSMYGKKYMGTIRSTFLLDDTGTIIAERRNVSASEHVKKVLEKAQEVVMHKQ
ncbi:MAG: peroxiredoxin [Candidatus Absconditabacterales bacterium]